MIFGIIHSLISIFFVAIFIFTLVKTPSEDFSFGLIIALVMSIMAIGIFKKRKWMRWVAVILILIATAFAFIMIAGSILWPESFADTVILVYLVFLALEISTIIYLSRLKKPDEISSINE